jgi:hypothetical protein
MPCSWNISKIALFPLQSICVEDEEIADRSTVLHYSSEKPQIGRLVEN